MGLMSEGSGRHGGLSSVMKLAKVFGESGVSAVHLEDQMHGGKKCGHQGPSPFLLSLDAVDLTRMELGL